MNETGETRRNSGKEMFTGLRQARRREWFLLAGMMALSLPAVFICGCSDQRRGAAPEVIDTPGAVKTVTLPGGDVR